MKRRAAQGKVEHEFSKRYWRRLQKPKAGQLQRATEQTLHELLNEDWSSSYPEAGGAATFYVYAHVRPSYVHETLIRFESDELQFSLPGAPFYIGKGVGQRAWDLRRNEGHGAELRDLLAGGACVDNIVHVLKDGLTESQALTLEAKLIHFFGTKFQGGRKGCLVNLDIPKRPEVMRCN